MKGSEDKMKIKTMCCECGKSIVIKAPAAAKNETSFTCNNCVPEHSAARDGINESVYTEYIPITKRMYHRLKYLQNNHLEVRKWKETLSSM